MRNSSFRFRNSYHEIPDREPARLFDRAAELARHPLEHLERSGFNNQSYPGWPIVIEPASGKRIK